MKPTTLALHAAGIVLEGLAIYSLSQKRMGKGIALLVAGLGTHGLATMTAKAHAAELAARSSMGSLVVIP